ncbi:MAG: glycosyltransferase, partial [Hyphomonadaceae bacterium]|nr:glycosyltransferase [Clostridia bacterium]
MQKKPRILLALMGLNIGGVETHVVELAHGLQKEGYEPIVVSNGGVYVKSLEEINIKHYCVPLINKKPKNLIKSYYMLKNIILDEKIDLVHAHARIPAFVLGKLHRRMKFPFVTTAHWVFVTNFWLKRLTDWGQVTLAVSNDIRTYLMKKYDVPAKQIKVTINGISTDKFTGSIDTKNIEKEFSIDSDKQHIVYMSRLDEDRSLVAHHVLDIADEVCAVYPNVDFIIVGSGNDYQNIVKKAALVNEKIGRRAIIMTGARTDVNAFVALAKVFIGVSRSALEAMAAKKPVIIAGNEGYMGIFDKSKLQAAQLSNFTCRGEAMADAEMLASDIFSLLELSDEERTALGEFGKQVVSEHYSISKMT